MQIVMCVITRWRISSVRNSVLRLARYRITSRYMSQPWREFVVSVLLLLLLLLLLVVVVVHALVVVSCIRRGFKFVYLLTYYYYYHYAT